MDALVGPIEIQAGTDGDQQGNQCRGENLRDIAAMRCPETLQQTRP